ncbi:MAG: hypothetical protein ACPHZ5_06235 [Candidatus Puniceispirillum sp.]
MANAKSVSVAYKNVDGIHFFWSADSQSTGLLATATEIPVVVKEVSNQLSILLGGSWAPDEDTKSVLKELETDSDHYTGCLSSGISFLGVHWTSQAA